MQNTVCNWARAAEGPSPAAADRGPIEPMGDSEDRAYDGFEGSLEERVRQLELENDILRAAAKVLKAESPSAMTDKEKALAVNELRLTDITEFGLPGGKVRLSPILDCFDGGLPAWSIGTSPNAELANSSLEAACGTLREGQRPVTHSDRGRRCRWPGWIAICEKNHLTRSMSKKGCSPDNSATEGFFDKLENEFFHHRNWSGMTIPEFCRMLDAYLRYYNEERPKEKMGWLSPMRYRRSLGLAA